ncbi:condensin complex subunit 2/barren [Sphaerosporella brunnea]|uniref:Condensin complex subunit 2 n=1 Tax=Sphaerosporella brunnea TaxID=1250544 RepID=A0A5J5EYD6_9PEZI|nr:condensin complex subunit 2/barren [Sphaerosporella brunnea]
MARSRGAAGPSAAGALSTPVRTTKIPLNDDSAEKAKRARERNLLQSIQKQKMIAAASPGAAARRQTLADGTSPKTPRNVGTSGGGGAGPIEAITPMKRVPILANWEEMMKLATDNKINATNSWNMALIDYFHDMSLLKEGDGVNFQRASCTLDGCIKVYTSRVDSVATETGKLLSGLADSANASKRKGRTGEGEGEGAEGSDEEEGEGEDGEKRRSKKKVNRSSEATLAKEFSQIQIKKLELEFSVDPLFKKASADFDEGGAKGLLLNHLSIDSNGRIVFDSSDDKDEKNDEEDDEEENPQQEQEVPDEPAEIINKLSFLKNKFFPDLSKLDNQDICPSLKGWDLNSSEGMTDIPFIKALEDRNDEDLMADVARDDDLADRPDLGFTFEDGYGVGDDDDMTMAFGQGGEQWANETIADAADRLLSPAKRLHLGPGDKEGDGQEGRLNVNFARHDDILSYFDEALQQNWAGPEHWRIRRIKDNAKPANAPVRVRKEKEAFEINFMDPAADPPAEVLQAPRTAHSIKLPKKDQISKSRNLLPDDKHFNSRQLIRLFLKPKSSIVRRKNVALAGDVAARPDEPPENLDEDFWAKENMAGEIQASSTPGPKGNYDANFFNDDNLDLPASLGDEDDDEAFADAREHFSPGPEGNPAMGGEAMPSQFPQSQAIDFGANLVTQSRRIRPEYVQYARVAKKVDVRKLKENIWSGLKFEDAPEAAPNVTPDDPNPTPPPSWEEQRKFTEVINNLRAVYPQKIMADISTSYCFICLLHLANERGLVVEEQEGANLQELVIRKDLNAHEADAY